MTIKKEILELVRKVLSNVSSRQDQAETRSFRNCKFGFLA